jgi:hypothetical protein
VGEKSSSRLRGGAAQLLDAIGESEEMPHLD